MMRCMKWMGKLALVFWLGACVRQEADLRREADRERDAGVDAGLDADVGENILQTPDWTWETHGKINPNYNEVFDDSLIHFDIEISPEMWTLLQQDVDEHLQGLQPGPGIDLQEWEPVFVPCTLRANGRTWYQVGIRVKGNSSLVSTYSRGIRKFSFKLDFDEFEDVWPQIRDQRFYGFKQLNLKNNFDDPSMLHESMTMELFRASGVEAPRARLATVVVDAGDGPQYYGVYTLVEEPDDTLVKTKFDDGNLYKPDGAAGTFGAGTYDEAGYNKKNHEEEADFRDIRRMYEALHDSRRRTDPAAWRLDLESAFDVYGFLQWLAANTVIQNWDSYGLTPHNYYLAFAPDAGRLVWIPWDANEAFTDGRERGTLSFGMQEVDFRWTLIRFLLDDLVYAGAYRDALQFFADRIFVPQELCARIAQLGQVIGEAARAERPPYTFGRPGADYGILLEELCGRITRRRQEALDFLGI